MDNLERFIKMQKEDYLTALAEIKKGKKYSHWIWYIFPQISGLGQSFMCKKYDIRNLDEAIDFLKNTYLRNNLCEISQALLTLKTNNIKSVMYYPDNLKLQSSMTLFKKADEKLRNSCNNLFQNVLDKFYDGKDDIKTLEILEEIEKNKTKHIIIEKNEKNSLDDGKNYKITKYFHVEDKNKKEGKKDKIDEKKEYKGNNETKEKISAKKEDENEGKKAANKDDKKEDTKDDKKEENIEDIKNVKKEKKKKEEKQEEKQDDKKDDKKDYKKDDKKNNKKDGKNENKKKETKKKIK